MAGIHIVLQGLCVMLNRNGWLCQVVVAGGGEGSWGGGRLLRPVADHEHHLVPKLQMSAVPSLAWMTCTKKTSVSLYSCMQAWACVIVGVRCGFTEFFVFWAIKRRKVAWNRRFGTICWLQLQGSSCLLGQLDPTRLDRQTVRKRRIKTTLRSVITQNMEEFNQVSGIFSVFQYCWFVSVTPRPSFAIKIFKT
jgi:hypothetical protein